MAKEKRIVINANVSNMEQKWGGENNTGEDITVLGTTVPDGYKWSVDFEKIEKFIKEQFGDKAGAFRWERPDGENFYYLLLFATKADAAAWDSDKTLTNYIERRQLPISAVQSDSYSARLRMDAVTGTKYKIKNGADFSVHLRYSSLHIIAATGETENMNIRGTLTIERSIDNQQTFVTVATLNSVIDSSEPDATGYPYTLDLTPYVQESRDNYFRIKASFVHEGQTETSGAVVVNVNSVSLDVERIGDWAQPIMASQGYFPMSYKVMGATERYLHIEVSGTVATYTAVRPLAASEEYPETNPLTFNLYESNSNGILTHGVHTVRVWLTCDDGSGHLGADGYPDSIVGEVAENRLMVVNTSATGINADYATPELLARPRLILQHVDTAVKNYVRAEIVKYAVWVPSSEDPTVASNEAIDVRLLLTNYGSSDTNYTQTYVDVDRTGTNGLVTGQQYTLDTAIEIEPEQGETLDSYIAYLRIFRYEGSTQINFMQQSIGNRFIGITVDNTENFAPTAGAWFILNPRTRSNADSNRTSIINAVDGSVIPTTGMGRFGFINDGYIDLGNGQKVFRVLAGEPIDISLDPFEDFIGSSSGNIRAQLSLELVYAVRNIVQEGTPIIDITQEIDDQQIGLRLTPLQGFINRVGAVNPTKPISDLTFGWEEDKATHFMMVVNPSVITRAQDELPWMQTEGGAVSQPLSLAKVYINGDPQREVDYPLEARIWADGNGKHIKIGNPYADIDIYGIRIYKTALSAEQVIQNYVASLPTAEEKRRVKQRNAITTSGRIDYEKTQAAGYRTLTWVGQDQYKTNQDKNTGYAGYWRIKHDNPALSGTICKAAYLAYMAGTLGGKKCLMITAQGSTANTYWENNGQTKMDKVTYVVNIPFSKVHSDFGWKASKSTGENCDNPMYLNGVRIEGTDYANLTDEEKALVTIDVVDGWFDGNGWSVIASEMGMYHGTFYTSTVGGAKCTKLVNKINYASPMQSHKMGATMLFNDTMKVVMGGGTALHKEHPEVRFAVKEESYMYFTENPANNFKPEFHGMCTFGDGKFDKQVFGIKADSRTFGFEGLNNNLPLCDFRVPADSDVTYSTEDEAWVYNGVKSFEYGLGKTDANGYPLAANDAVFRKYVNFMYCHNTRLRYYEGTRQEFAAAWETLVQDAQANAATIADMQNHQYWFTRDYKKIRYDYVNEEWVDAGTWNQSTLAYSSGECVLSTDAMTASVYDTWAASQDYGDYDVLNGLFKEAIARHAATYFESVGNLTNHLTHYNLVNFLMAGTDNCSKNTYYQYDPDEEQIFLDQDDLDSIWCTDNNGRQTKDYFLDRIHDVQDYTNGYKAQIDYEGRGSVLFNLIEDAFEVYGTELRQNMRQVLTAMASLVSSTDGQEQSVMGCLEKYFLSTQEYFPQIAYAEQGRVRYEFPKSWGYISHGTQARSIDPITQQVGSQLSNERQYMKRRLAYAASYACWGGFSGGANPGVIGTALNADANLSLSPGQGNYGADYTFVVVPHQWLYPSGTNQGRDAVDPHVRVAPGDTFTFSVGAASGDGAVGLNAINYYRKIGNLGDMTVTSVLNVTAQRLVEFIAEPTNPATSLFSPASLNLNCPNLQKLSLKGVSAVGGTQNYSSLVRAVEIDLRGTTIRTVGVPQSTALEILKLPETLTSITLTAQPALTTLVVEDTAEIATATVNNIPNTTSKALITQIKTEQGEDRELDTLTLLGINWTGISYAMLEWLAEIETLVLTGRVEIDSLTIAQYEELVELYGAEAFEYGSDFMIDYSTSLIEGPTALKNGDTGQYQALIFPLTDEPTQYLLYDGDTLVEAETDSQDRVYREQDGVRLYEATGIVEVDGTITEGTSLVVKAKAGDSYSPAVTLVVTLHTYPTVVNILGSASIDANGEYDYTRAFNWDGFDAEIVSTVWELSTTSIATLTPDSSGYEATLAVTGASDIPNTLTLSLTVTLTGARVLTASKEVAVREIVQYVDLGLPSGLLWATMNVGATLPEETGLYFAWGETTGYADAAARNTALGRSGGFDQGSYEATGASAISADLTLAQDGARVTKGGGWRMPKTADFTELFNSSYTTNEWTTLNGANGLRITSKSNGKSIFIPARSYMDGNSDAGTPSSSLGWYFSSSYYNTQRAKMLTFDSSAVVPSANYHRYRGTPLRPVLGKHTVTINLVDGEGHAVKLPLEISSSAAPTEKVTTDNNGQAQVRCGNWTISISCQFATLSVSSVAITEDTVVNIVATDIKVVDLGLPSGTLWATGNIVKDAQGNYSIGAETDYWCYFSWGNIDGHNEYSEDNYSFDDTNYNASPGNQLTASIPSNDAEHDAAVARLGNGWHMPTSANFQELFNSNNCTWQWTSVNGVNGYLITSKMNGNTLFFPASGHRDGSSLSHRGRLGSYWSSSFNNATNAYNLYFNSGTVIPAYYNNRRFGLTIRPVQ